MWLKLLLDYFVSTSPWTYQCCNYYRLTAGIDNCLFHFQYYDNLEGVFISSEADVGGVSQLNNEIYKCFQTACQKIKQMFDSARRTKVWVCYIYDFGTQDTVMTVLVAILLKQHVSKFILIFMKLFSIY
jgi:hypothetical protein